jgi:hypothetical protein
MKKIILSALLSCFAFTNASIADGHSHNNNLSAALMCSPAIMVHDPRDILKVSKYKTHIRKQIHNLAKQENIENIRLWTFLGQKYFNQTDIENIEDWNAFVSSLIKRRIQQGDITEEKVAEIVEQCDLLVSE